MYIPSDDQSMTAIVHFHGGGCMISASADGCRRGHAGAVVVDASSACNTVGASEQDATWRRLTTSTNSSGRKWADSTTVDWVVSNKDVVARDMTHRKRE